MGRQSGESKVETREDNEEVSDTFLVAICALRVHGSDLILHCVWELNAARLLLIRLLRGLLTNKGVHN